MDVRAIQEALKAKGFYTSNVDGIAGTLTRDAIKAFQRANALKVDGIAGPRTLTVLFPASKTVASIPLVEGSLLTAARLKRMWPNGKPEIIAGVAASAGTVLPLYGITTNLRLLHLMTQISHECGGGRIVEENLNYSKASRIAEVWSSRFTTASATPYVMNARALANKVYNGRMGNRVGSSDGYDYRGRGLIQITGRDAYRTIGKITGLDLEKHPSLATEPANLLPIACAFWKWKNLNPLCTNTSDVTLVAITKKVNGGTNGLTDRRAWHAKWKRELGL